MADETSAWRQCVRDGLEGNRRQWGQPRGRLSVASRSIIMEVVKMTVLFDPFRRGEGRGGIE